MTFDQLVSEVMSRLNLTSSTATTRVGAAINRKYREITASVGLNVTRRVEVPEATTINSPYLIFSELEKVINVIDKRSGKNKKLDLVTVEEIQDTAPIDGDNPSCYAIWKMDANQVTILLNQTPETSYTLYANGYSQNTTLSGSDVPAFPDSYHEVLVEGVLYDEYRKMEKPTLARMAKETYDQLLSDLRMFIVKDYLENYPGKTKDTSIRAGSGGGSGNGDGDSCEDCAAASFTITGLHTYDRDPSAPFAVVSGSAVVTNLDADKLDGEEGSAYHNAANLTGTIAAISGVNVTNLNASNLASGTVPDARFPATLPAASGANLTALNATNISSGTLAHARKSSSTTTTATGNQDNFSFSSSDELLCNNASLLTIRGLAAGVAGQRLSIVSIGAGQVDINNQDTNSTAANRVINHVTGTISLAPGVGRALLEYDATAARWRVLFHEQGDYITPTFAAGDYTGNGSMTWTVAAGDVATCKYYLRGRQLTVSLRVITSTVGGTPSTALQRAIPGGFTTSGADDTAASVSDNGTPLGAGHCRVTSNLISFYRDISLTGNWSAATDTTAVAVVITFGVS